MKKIISKFTLITLLVFSGNSIMAQDSIPKQEHNYKMHSPKGKMHSPKGKMHSPKGKMHSPKDKMHSPKGKMHSPKGKMRSPKGRTPSIPKELMESLSNMQKELLSKGGDLLREQRKVLRDMLSNIQKETLKDSSLSFNERKREIMSKMRRKQRKLVSDFENRHKIYHLKEELRKTLTKDQIDIISKHQKRSKRKSKRYD